MGELDEDQTESARERFTLLVEQSLDDRTLMDAINDLASGLRRITWLGPPSELAELGATISCKRAASLLGASMTVTRMTRGLGAGRSLAPAGGVPKSTWWGETSEPPVQHLAARRVEYAGREHMVEGDF